MDMSLSKLQETVKDREARRAAVHGVTKRHEFVTEQWQHQLIMLSIGNLNLKARNSSILFFTYFLKIYFIEVQLIWAFLVPQMVKNPPANAGSQSLILGSRRSLEKWMATHPVFLPGDFHGQKSPWGSQRVGQGWAANSFNFNSWFTILL